MLKERNSEVMRLLIELSPCVGHVDYFRWLQYKVGNENSKMHLRQGLC